MELRSRLNPFDNAAFDSGRNARKLKKRQGRLGDTWYLAEVFIKIRGELNYLWRAVAQDGDTIDILVHKRRNKACVWRIPIHAAMGV